MRTPLRLLLLLIQTGGLGYSSQYFKELVSGFKPMNTIIFGIRHEGNLRDLFFGKWRAQYEAIKNEGLRNLGNHFKYTLKEYNLPSLRRNEKSPKSRRSFYD